MFDTVQRLGWRVDVRKHTIKTVVKDVLEGDAWWGDDSEEEGAEELGPGKRRRRKTVVPKPMIETDCVVSNLRLACGGVGADVYE